MSTNPLIDIGVNLTNARFRNDLGDVIADARQAGVEHMVVTGTDLSQSQDALDLTLQYPGYLSCTSGVHPHDSNEWNVEVEAGITALAEHSNVVAVGECGLDYFRNFAPHDVQINCFRDQLAMAVKLKKPVFLHQRDAHEAFIEIVSEVRNDLSGAVVHCFTGNTTEALDYLDLDCYLGITGWLCDERRGDELRQAVKSIPLDRLMIETDAPYLLPRTIRPKPASNRNVPGNLPHILEALSRILGQNPHRLAEILVENTRRFFNLPTGPHI